MVLIKSVSTVGMVVEEGHLPRLPSESLRRLPLVSGRESGLPILPIPPIEERSRDNGRMISFRDKKGLVLLLLLPMVLFVLCVDRNCTGEPGDLALPLLPCGPSN